MAWMLLPLRRYFQFSGRSRRKEYWMFMLFLFLLRVVAAVIDFALGYDRPDDGPVGMIAGLATMIPSLAVGVRRMHDFNRSGWWIISPALALVPLLLGYLMSGGGGIPTIFLVLTVVVGVGFGLVVFIWTVMRGTVGPNRYGPDPVQAVA